MKMNLFFMSILALGVSVTIGCAPRSSNNDFELNPQNNNSIVNGSEVSPDSDLINQVFVIQMKNGDTYSQCSATAITKRVLLTAAHCVAKGPESVEALLGISVPGKPKFRVTAKAIIWDKGYQFLSYRLSGLFTQSDIALIVLNRDLPNTVQITKINDGPEITKGTKVIISGYGLNEKDPIKDGNRIEGKNGVHLAKGITSFNEKESSTLAFKGGAISCFGDSGGPAFIKSASGELIQIGISSRTESGSCLGESYYESVHDNYSWIKENLKKIDLYFATTEQKETPPKGPTIKVGPENMAITLEKGRALLKSDYFKYDCRYTMGDHVGYYSNEDIELEDAFRNAIAVDTTTVGNELELNITSTHQQADQITRKTVVNLKTAGKQSVYSNINIEVYLQQKTFLRKTPWVLIEKYQCKPEFYRLFDL